MAPSDDLQPVPSNSPEGGQEQGGISTELPVAPPASQTTPPPSPANSQTTQAETGPSAADQGTSPNPLVALIHAFMGLGERLPELSSLQWKLVGLALLVIVVTTLVLHHKGTLIIYKDYTDATITGVFPLVIGLVYMGLLFFELPQQKATEVALALGLIWVIAVSIATIDANGLNPYAAMSLVTKLGMMVVYYGALVFLIAALLSPSARAKGESQRAYRARVIREGRAARSAIAGLTVGTVAMSGWLCREPRFTPIKSWLSSA